jgi:hypothetical protein
MSTHPEEGRAHGLHDADLPHLLGDDGVHGVDDQKGAQPQSQDPHDGQDDQHRVDDVLHPVDVWIGDLVPTDGRLDALQAVFDALGRRLGGFLAVRFQAHVQLVVVPPILVAGQPGSGLRRGVKRHLAAHFGGEHVVGVHHSIDRHTPLTSSKVDEDVRAGPDVQVF